MDQTILAKWFAKELNFGDLLAPFLIERLSGKRPINLMHQWRGRNLLKHDVTTEAGRLSLRQRLSFHPQPEYLTVGSVLGWSDWREDVQVVWGAGFMFPHSALRFRPRRIHAVRGQLSHDLLPPEWRDQISGLGDPGLLVADYFDAPKSASSSKIGVIAHYKQRNHPVMQAIGKASDFKIIQIQQEVIGFVNDLTDCELVLSSAMHGLIAADSFGIPNRWINFGEMLDGGNFKFRDYYSVFGGGQDYPDAIASIADLHAAARQAKSRDATPIKQSLRQCHPF